MDSEKINKRKIEQPREQVRIKRQNYIMNRIVKIAQQFQFNKVGQPTIPSR
jgi:hypothetical protein